MKNERFANFNRVNTKEELLVMLKKYRGILNDSMVSYLNSLIELEFSVVRDYINVRDRKILAELGIYKSVAIYNIYNRAINLFSDSDIPVKIIGNAEGDEGLKISLEIDEEKSIELFGFSYAERESRKFKIPNGYKTMQIGRIDIYQTLESEKLREKELNRIMDRLEKLYDEQNPYPFFDRVSGFKWEIEHQDEMWQYEKKVAELDCKKDLTDDEKREIEITNRVHDLILEDYGLRHESFEEFPVHNLSGFQSELQKTFVKKQPNLVITNNIKCI